MRQAGQRCRLDFFAVGFLVIFEFPLFQQFGTSDIVEQLGSLVSRRVDIFGRRLFTAVGDASQSRLAHSSQRQGKELPRE